MAASYTRRINLYINGKVVRNDIKSISTEMRKLERNIKTLEMNSRAYNREMARIKYLKSIIAEHNAQLQVTNINLTSLKGIANAFNKFMPMIMGTIGTFVGLSMSVRRIATDFTNFDDKLADVMKVTGKSRQEVIELNEELKKMDTRTAQETLLELAWVAGKLGINATPEILGFVNAADKIAVALSKDLGGNAEEAIRAIGKAVEIFDLKQIYGVEEAMIRVGSAVNELGMASVAQEGYLVKFVERVAGIAPLAGVSLQNILGLAGALDIYGQKSEVSATAYSKLMSKMATETEVMARLMGMSIRDYITLFTEDANEAMLRLFDVLKGEGNAAFNELVVLLGDAELEGQRMTQVMGALVKNVDRIREQQQISNKAFEEGTSVINEFNIKNNNAQAIVEKKQRALKNLRIELGEKLLPVYIESMNVFERFLIITTDLVKWIFENGRALASTLIYLIAYRTILKTLIFFQNGFIFTGKLWIASVLKISQAYFYLTGNISRAAAAQRLFNRLQFANVWLAIASVITAATAALWFYIKRKKEVAETEKAAADIQKRTTEEYAQQTAEVRRLRSAVENETLSLGYRKEALQELRKIIPDYHAELTNEGKLINNNIAAVNNWIEATKREIRMRVRKEKYAELVQLSDQNIDKIEAARKNLQIAELDLQKATDQVLRGLLDSKLINVFTVKVSRAKSKLDDLLKLQEEYAMAMKKIEDDLSKMFKSSTEWAPLKSDWEKFLRMLQMKPGDAMDWSKEEEERQRQALIARRLRGEYMGDEERFQRDLSNLQIRFMQGRLSQLDADGEEWLKTHGDLLDARLKLLQDDEKRLDALGEATITSPIDKEKLRYQKQLKDLGLFYTQYTKMTSVQQQAFETLEFEHQTNLNKIDAEAIRDRFKNIQDAFEERLTFIEHSHALETEQITTLEQAREYLQNRLTKDELDKLKTLEEAKKEIRRQQQLDIIAETREFYQRLLDDLNFLTETGYLEGIITADNVLSEAEKEEIRKRLAEIITKITEVINTKEKLTGDDEKDPKTKNLRHGMLSVDMFGFRPDDWQRFFDFTDEAVTSIDRIGMALYAMGNVWRDVNDLIAANENRALQEYEQRQERRKKALDDQLKYGVISHEYYQDQIEKIDKQTDRQRAILAYKQAKRARNLAAFEAAINTMVAVTKAYKDLGPAGIPFAVALATLGGIQVAAIMAKPLPEIPGYQYGGFVDVLRAQDKRRFRARNDLNKRGFINRPTILAGEKPEYIVNNEALKNPTIKPFIDMIEMQRLNNNLSQVDMRAEMPNIVGFQSGGFSYQPTPNNHQNAKHQTLYQNSLEPTTLNPQLLTAINRLNHNLENGIEAHIVYQKFRKFQDKVNETENQNTL